LVAAALSTLRSTATEDGLHRRAPPQRRIHQVQIRNIIPLFFIPPELDLS